MKYHRTGEYRAPKKGEWYETAESQSWPSQAGDDFVSGSRWILEAVEDAPKDKADTPAPIHVSDMEPGAVHLCDKDGRLLLRCPDCSREFVANDTVWQHEIAKRLRAERECAEAKAEYAKAKDEANAFRSACEAHLPA